MKLIAILVLMLTMALVSRPLLSAERLDLHKFWDDRCLECHGHAAEFAREYLGVTDGKLVGRHHIENIRQFLGNHYLAESEVDATYKMLLAQVSTQARFKNECSECHNAAADFTRGSLELRNGVLYGRESGKPVTEFLNNHRKLDLDDVKFFSELLIRVAGETGL
jgi:hypothetical protein